MGHFVKLHICQNKVWLKRKRSETTSYPPFSYNIDCSPKFEKIRSKLNVFYFNLKYGMLQKKPVSSNCLEKITYNCLKTFDQNKLNPIFSVCTSEPRLTQNRRGSKYRQRALCVHCSQESSGVS